MAGKLNAGRQAARERGDSRHCQRLTTGRSGASSHRLYGGSYMYVPAMGSSKHTIQAHKLHSYSDKNRLRLRTGQAQRLAAHVPPVHYPMKRWGGRRRYTCSCTPGSRTCRAPRTSRRGARCARRGYIWKMPSGMFKAGLRTCLWYTPHAMHTPKKGGRGAEGGGR